MHSNCFHMASSRLLSSFKHIKSDILKRLYNYVIDALNPLKLYDTINIFLSALYRIGVVECFIVDSIFAVVFLGLELERGVQIFCTSVLSGQLLGSIEVSMLLYTREIKRFHVCFLTADMLLHRRVPIIKFRRLVKFIRPAFNIGCVVNLSNKGFILFRNIL